MDLYEALYTTRAMRRVHPDPVPEEVVRIMLDAAVRAPTGGNLQAWRFLTVTDPEVKEELGPLYRRAWETLQTSVYAGVRERAEAAGDDQTLRILRSSQWLADHFEEVPLWVLAFDRAEPTGSSIFPAVWSMMLAARGQGVGTALTTILGLFESDAAFEVLGVPADKGWRLAAAVSAGYPKGRWDVARRRPAHRVTYAERWGEQVSWRVDEPLWSAGS